MTDVEGLCDMLADDAQQDAIDAAQQAGVARGKVRPR